MNTIKPFDPPIHIIRPVLPDLSKVFEKLREIWESKWLTNMGDQHKALELKLLKYLKTKYLSLFCNGTLALELAIEALELTGEVITTPFTFPATVNSLYRKSVNPIFCDIKLNDLNIDEDGIEDLISPKTSGIMPVHVFGNPCEVEKLEKIAKRNNLKVIYDAAHCFGVEYKDIGIGNFGDISMFSFHATKIFHTIEGGALTYNNDELKEKLYLLKNFGIKNEEEIILPGTNAKMNEIQAAIGLICLDYFQEEVEKRKERFLLYKDYLADLSGIDFIEQKENIKYNYQYCPILIDQSDFKYNRNDVYNHLKKYNVNARKYFYPLCIDYKYFKPDRNYSLSNANKISNQVLCLPLYGELKQEDIFKISNIISSLHKS